MGERKKQARGSTEGKVDEKPSSFLSKCSKRFRACKRPIRGCCVFIIVAIVLCSIGVVAALIVRREIFSPPRSEDKKDQISEKPTKRTSWCWPSSYSFPRRNNTSDYARYKGVVPMLLSGTACMWLYASDVSHDFGFFSYAISEEQDNHFLLFYDHVNKVIEFDFAGDKTTASVQLAVNSGVHICAWFNAHTQSFGLYINGRRSNAPVIIDADALIGGGSLILAQDQDNVGGGFDPAQAMTGTVENAMMWPRVLNRHEIMNILQDCVCPPGKVVAMTSDKMELFGEAVYRAPDSC